MLDEFKSDTRVVHCQRDEYDIYIGRGNGSIWGNPFTHIKSKDTLAHHIVKNREEAISKYREWILQQPQLLEKLPELKGKRLGCWCYPKRCHGEILIELINQI